jgi:hypothetical protein
MTVKICQIICNGCNRRNHTIFLPLGGAAQYVKGSEDTTKYNTKEQLGRRKLRLLSRIKQIKTY